MSVAKVTSKGQVTLPVKVRQRLGLKTGSYLSFEPLGNDYVLRVLPNDPLDELEGFFQYEGPIHTVEEMNTAISEKAASLFEESHQE